MIVALTFKDSIEDDHAYIGTALRHYEDADVEHTLQYGAKFPLAARHGMENLVGVIGAVGWGLGGEALGDSIIIHNRTQPCAGFYCPHFHKTCPLRVPEKEKGASR